eukprot:TRINITY_DN29402_c0_g1_i1.p1 TRINITY_DN29402_c0_g1~~TRINITY_DN29402_c0_g1_i1.p1  ORF type:complete len:688 (+),score=114.64 TRINITY_DN29402_c0_g1_i1:42-2105(+)
MAFEAGPARWRAQRFQEQQRFPAAEPSSSSSVPCSSSNSPSLLVEDYEFGTLLGEGAFARVVRARDLRNGSEYAMKIIDKKMIQVHDRKNGVMTERMMLLSMNHPGIVSLKVAFQDDWSLYFGLELVLGGELAKQIERMGICSQDFARFYSAEIVSILVYLRIKRVAHRDLKPENLLLTTEGHLKLVDFDAAIFVPDEGEGDAAGGRRSQGGGPQQPLSFVGTALYVAPEVILGTAQLHQAFALDLWALGCIIYLMLVGTTPFHAESEYLVFQRIQRGDYSFPAGFKQYEEAQCLIEALLSAEPSKRPGQGPEHLADLQRHAFFGGSAAAYSELRRQRPPPRVTAAGARRGGLLSRQLSGGSEEPESMPFDFASSAECTPEVGQNFLTRRATQVALLAEAVRLEENEPDPETFSRYSSASGAPEFLAQGESPEFQLSIESRQPDPWVGSPASSEGEPVAVAAVGAAGAHRQPQVLSQSLPAPPAAARHPLTPSSVSTSNSGISEGDGTSTLTTPPTGSRQNLAEMICGISCRQWQQDLAQRHILLRGEDVRLGGRVVRRTFPCLRQKLLILTDLPRLLVLDPAGRRLLQDLDLSADPGSSCRGPSDSLYEPVLQVNSHTDFQIRLPGGHCLRCRDNELCAEVWREKISAALSDGTADRLKTDSSSLRGGSHHRAMPRSSTATDTRGP